LHASSLTPVQASISGVTKISAGYWYSMALKSDGTVWTWGEGQFGVIGDGGVGDEYVPKQVLTDCKEIEAHYSHSFAIKNDGTLWGWGANEYGQVGTGATSTWELTPVQVTGLASVIAVAAGSYHALALTSGGDVYAWGLNDKGQLGTGDTPEELTPHPTPELVLSGAIAISAASFHSVALMADGTVKAWGDNTYGQVGDNTTTQRLTPTTVLNLSGITAISASFYHSHAIDGSGNVWSWGRNNLGQLGDGTQTDRHAPVQTSLTGINQVSTGLGWFSMALVLDATRRPRVQFIRIGR
jgi:alpha-tubulin suppressor-like RCC1 family protein